MVRSKYAASLQRECKVLRVVFDTLEALRVEYDENLQRGGLFVPDSRPMETREEVQVEFDLSFASTSFKLAAEVVGVLPQGLPHSGGRAGVALQLAASSEDLRRAFEPIIGNVPSPDRGRQVGERRVAPRHPARVVGRLSSDDGEVAVRTRDLSSSGVLISLDGVPPVPVGKKVSLMLAHPSNGQEVAVDAVVVRHVESEGHVPALAVAFTEQEAERSEVKAFVEDLQSMAHARDLAAITGPLSEMDLATLLQSFAAGTPRGTITLSRGVEEGRVIFEEGRVLAMRVGAATGSKALARLLVWDDGRFEFHSDIQHEERDDPVMPIEMALLDAARQVDERRRLEPLPYDMADLLELVGDAESESSCKTEAAVLDLAQADFAIRSILDVVPEEDHVVLGAIGALLDRGVVRVA